MFELNAETKDTLINSFYDLAYALAKLPELKKEINFIQQIQDPKIRENQLLNFVKAELKKRANWLLLYDNIQNLSQIRHLLPNDPKQWGNGKVIITTRNEHIKETSYINPNNIIHIDKLSNNERLILFVKILYDTKPDQLNQADREEIISFLKNIPPFPLDVSVAAYSIKNTHVTFKQYLDHINEYSKGYEDIQVQLLREVTDYSKTRYGIISSTIEKLDRINTDFKELFLFICLLDSQNIPYKLLENYKAKNVIEEFIYKLRQNGLLLKESYSDFAKANKVISLHRSTQQIGAAFLMNSLTQSERDHFVHNAVLAINSFYQTCTKNKDIKNILLLVPHINALLNVINNTDISTTSKKREEIDLLITLGYIHNKYTKNLLTAKECFEKVLEKIEDSHFLSTEVHAKLLKDLGAICAITNQPVEALKYCKKSMAIYKTLPNSEIMLADILQIAGTSYRKMNNFAQAHTSLQKALEIISTAELTNLKELKAEIYAQLGHLYLTKYLNKKEAQATEYYDTEALKTLSGFEVFHTQNKPLPPHISCDVARYRWKYSEIFMFHYENYDLAYHHLREAEYIMNNKCPENMHLKGRIFGLLGEAFLGKNNPTEAEKLLTESINILSIALGPSNVWIDNIRRAEAEIRLGKFNEAYADCLHIFQLGHVERTNFHDLRYYTTYYHAAFAKYKLGDYFKSFKHFVDFFKSMDTFCKGFCDEETYQALKTAGIFTITPYKKETILQDIKIYLKHSAVIFTAIYTDEHPFVRDYVKKNIEL